MLNTEMLAVVRRNLDEASAAFYSDAQIYEGITEGQRQVVNAMLSVYEARLKVDPMTPIPEAIKVLFTSTASTLSAGALYFSLPADYLKDIYVEYNHASSSTLKPCYKIVLDNKFPFLINNTYLYPTGTNEYIYFINASQVIFNVAAGASNNYLFAYLKKPTDIDASTQPILPEFTHEAIVNYATAEMLNKDYRLSEAGTYFNKYLQLIQSLF